MDNLISDRKACPFCGKVEAIKIVKDDRDYYSLMCTNCNAQLGTRHRHLQDALDAWNERPIETVLQNKLVTITKSFTELSTRLNNLDFENADLRTELKLAKAVLKKNK